MSTAAWIASIPAHLGHQPLVRAAHCGDDAELRGAGRGGLLGRLDQLGDVQPDRAHGRGELARLGAEVAVLRAAAGLEATRCPRPRPRARSASSAPRARARAARGCARPGAAAPRPARRSPGPRPRSRTCRGRVRGCPSRRQDTGQRSRLLSRPRPDAGPTVAPARLRVASALRCTDRPRAADLLALDREHVWHPYTSMTDPTPTRLVDRRRGRPARARGRSRGRSTRCRRGGLRSTATGTRCSTRPDDAGRLDVRTSCSVGSPMSRPSRLAERLVGLTPSRARARVPRRLRARSASRSRSRWPCSTSAGADVPSAPGCWRVRGGYHGDTFGAMSVCDPVGGMHTMFAEVLPQQVFAARPPAGSTPTWPRGRRAFRALAARHAARAGRRSSSSRAPGRRRHARLQRRPACAVMREVADEHGLVLVFDEIATGFGRTGTLFAAEAAGVVARRHVRRQGAHRRLPDAGGGAVHARGRARALAIGVRACSCTARPTWATRSPAPSPLANLDLLADRRLAGRCRGGSKPGWPQGLRRLPRAARSRRRAHARRGRRHPARPPGRRRQGDGGGARRTASGCGRSATSSTRCRRTSAPTTTSRAICAAIEAAAVVGMSASGTTGCASRREQRERDGLRRAPAPARPRTTT